MNAWKTHFGDMFSDDEEDDDVIVIENPEQETSTKPSSSKLVGANSVSKGCSTSKEVLNSDKAANETIDLNSRTESSSNTKKSCEKEEAPSGDVAISAMALFKRVEAKIKTLAEDQSTKLDSEILDQVAEKVVEILKFAYQNPDQQMSSFIDKFVSTPGERCKKIIIQKHVKDLIQNIIQERKRCAAKPTIYGSDNGTPRTLPTTPSSSPELSRIHSSPLDHSVGFLQGERISLKYCSIPLWNRMVNANPNEPRVKTFSTIRGKHHTPVSKFKPINTTDKSEDEDVQIIENLSIDEAGKTNRKPSRQNAFSTASDTPFTTSTRTIKPAESSPAKHNGAEISNNKTIVNDAPIEERNSSPLPDMPADLPEVVPMDQDEPLVFEESVVSEMDISKDPEHIYVTDDAVKHFIEHKLAISLLPAAKLKSQQVEVISISSDDPLSSSQISSTSEFIVDENHMDIDAPQQSKSLHTGNEATLESSTPTSCQEQTSQENVPLDKRHAANDSGPTGLSSLPGPSRWDDIFQADARADEAFPEFIPIEKEVPIKSSTSRSKRNRPKSNLSKSAKAIIPAPVMTNFSESLREIFQKYAGTPSDEFMSDSESETSVVAEEQVSKKSQSSPISANQMMNIREGTSRAGFPCKKRKVVVTEDDEVVILSTNHTAQRNSDDVKMEPVSEIQMDLDAHLERQQNVTSSQKPSDDFRKVFAKVSQWSQPTTSAKPKSRKRKKSKVKISKRSEYEVEQKDKMETAAKRFRSCLKGSPLAAGRKNGVKVSFSEEPPEKKYYIIPEGNTLVIGGGEEQPQQQGQ
ncbi:hypothetical protein Ddc_09561 [Ditylenchus destructor]|nr:hypothetical protein Ddc_09561 [Ditylenchus destructor]